MKIPLLERKEQLEIIAIQEPWINPKIQATYCPADSPYGSVFANVGQARTCFLINKAIPVSMWTQDPNQITSDYCSITVQLATGPLTIHYVYSPIPPSVNSTEWETPLGSMLLNVNNIEGEHLVVGDFNLHHPLWGGILVDQSNKGATQLVEAVEAGMLKLLSVPVKPTSEKYNNRPST